MLKLASQADELSIYSRLSNNRPVTFSWSFLFLEPERSTCGFVNVAFLSKFIPFLSIYPFSSKFELIFVNSLFVNLFKTKH